MTVMIRVQTDSFITEYPLTPFVSAVVGRGVESDYKVKDPYTSLAHCRFTLKADKLEIQDLKSKNGTYLNGIKISHSEMFIGDIVKIGETKVSLVTTQMEPYHVKILTFQGGIQQRLSHELRADFTSVFGRQLQPVFENYYKMKRFERSNYRPDQDRFQSKETLRSKYKVASTLSSLVDLGILMLVIFVPLMVIDELAQTQNFSMPQRLLYLVICEACMVSLYCYMNFHLSNFSIGEKLGGIERLYHQQ
jgi:hypothetical protein